MVIKCHFILGYALIQLPEILIVIYKFIYDGRLSNRLSSSKPSSAINRLRKIKAGQKRKIGPKPGDVNHRKVESDRISEDPNFAENEAEQDGDLTPVFITEIKRQFSRMDDRMELIELKLDFLSKELKVK